MSKLGWRMAYLSVAIVLGAGLLVALHTMSTRAQISADISITKSVDGPAYPLVGDLLTYTLNIRNNGSTSTTVTVTDLLSYMTDPITYSGEIVVGTGTGTVVVGQGGTVNAIAGVVYTWQSVDPIPPGESFALTIVVRINREADPGDIITNVAWANNVRSNQTSVRVWDRVLFSPLMMRNYAP